MRNYDRAIADFNEAIRLSPLFSNAFVNRGNAHWEKGARETAMTDYDQAARLDPVNAFVFLSRGRAYRIAGEYDRAVEDFDQMIRLQRTNASAWNERCYTHLVADTALSNAVADCSDSLKLNPNSVPALDKPRPAPSSSSRSRIAPSRTTTPPCGSPRGPPVRSTDAASPSSRRAMSKAVTPTSRPPRRLA